MKRHWLTTLFGFALAFGSALTQAPTLRDNPLARDVGAIILVLASIGLGATAADSRKVPNGKDSARRDPR